MKDDDTKPIQNGHCVSREVPSAFSLPPLPAPWLCPREYPRYFRARPTCGLVRQKSRARLSPRRSRRNASCSPDVRPAFPRRRGLRRNARAERIDKGAALRKPSLQLEGDKSAACGHLAPDDLGLRKICKARVVDGSHRWMGRKHLRHGQGSARMLRHAQFERL
jgi:hypothetical protein